MSRLKDYLRTLMFSIIHFFFMFFSNMMQSILFMNKLFSAIVTFDNGIMVNLSHVSYQLFIRAEFQLIYFAKKFRAVKKPHCHRCRFQVIKLSCKSINFPYTVMSKSICSNQLGKAILKFHYLPPRTEI